MDAVLIKFCHAGCEGLQSSSAKRTANTIGLDAFCLRQFDDPNYSGPKINHDKNDFMARVNAFCAEKGLENVLVDGYAPFCKHIFIPNFVAGLKAGAVEITDENRKHLISKYEARTEKELPVLVRYFSRYTVEPPEAAYLDLILYSREQIEAENASMGNSPPPYSAAWGLISVKPQMEAHETPMQPITMMRNALGKEHGGSGVALEREKYNASVQYWDTYVSIPPEKKELAGLARLALPEFICSFLLHVSYLS